MCKPYVSAIIAAAGNSSRMGGELSKQLIKISGKTVLEYSLIAFSNSEYVKEIIVSAKEDEVSEISKYSDKYPKLKAVVAGGKTRQESVKNAISKIDRLSEIVTIHDAARPLISTDDIDSIIIDTIEFNAVCPVTRVVDTVKSSEDGYISETLDRNKLFLASTPQTFKTNIYKKAIERFNNLESFTDDCSIVEAIGQKVHIHIMENKNTKLTTLDDLSTIKHSLSQSSIRIGHGYDVHKLVKDRKLILGGVDIPHETGLLGHSDADVLLHAIMDALLGAAGLGDIGRHFPDTSGEFKDISSLLLLERVHQKLKSSGYSVSNIDATVIAQAPKLSKFIPQMVTNIASVLNIGETSVNIKATTEEHLGFTGEKLGISAHAVCTITG